MESIKLDLIPGKKMPSLNASQYDDGRDYHIDLTENRVPYVLDGTETISLTVRKCDNTLVTMDIANTFADKSYIEFRTTEQMNACAGFNYGEITIEKNGTQISSLNFYLQVEGAPDEGGITSQSEINNLARQVHDIVAEELEDNGAEETGYDNTESGLDATNVQDALDELANKPSVDAYTKQESDAFITDEYDATSTYAVGDMVIHENALYVCSTAITTAEAWNSAHWTLTDIATAISDKADKTDNYRAVKVNNTEVLGKGANTDALNFYDTANVVWGYDNINNRVKAYLQGVPSIDDSTVATDKVWSSKKSNSILKETEIINQNIYSMLYVGNLNNGNVGYKKGNVNLLTGEFITPNATKTMVDINYEPIELKSDTIILHIATGWRTRGVILKPDKTFDSNFTAWSTGGTVDALQNKKGYYAMLVVAKTDDSDITDQERNSANEKTMYIEAVLGLENGIVGEIQKGNKSFTGKKIVNFGDSLFGNFRDDNTTTHKSISKMISENTGATVYNAGFGGCRMSERLYGSAFWNAFAMYALADSVYSEDWSVQDQALIDGAGTIPDYFADTVAMLKTIDFSEVDIITISYGTNDYTGETPLTGSGVEYQNYEGALRYSLRKLLSKYPSMRIVVLSPAWRFWYSGGAYSYSSDDEQSRNNNGDLLTDFVASCDDVCKEYHIPYVDMYYNLGFNPYSYQAYFSDIDSTHPIQVGRQLMADRISGQLSALLHH